MEHRAWGIGKREIRGQRSDDGGRRDISESVGGEHRAWGIGHREERDQRSDDGGISVNQWVSET